MILKGQTHQLGSMFRAAEKKKKKESKQEG
jgi:hypothetical protein